MTHKPTLLYVDDEQANILLFKVNFCKSFTLITANSGQEALSKLESNSEISIVVSDLRMPGMSGIELVLNAKKCHPNIHYFILSGQEVSDEIKKYMNKKILAGYFCKPISIDLITNILNSYSKRESD